MKVRALIGRIAAVVVVLALAGGGVYLFMTQPAKAPVAAQAPPPPQVGVVALAAADVPLPLEFSGRVAGFRVVDPRPGERYPASSASTWRALSSISARSSSASIRGPMRPRWHAPTRRPRRPGRR